MSVLRSFVLKSHGSKPNIHILSILWEEYEIMCRLGTTGISEDSEKGLLYE